MSDDSSKDTPSKDTPGKDSAQSPVQQEAQHRRQAKELKDAARGPQPVTLVILGASGDLTSRLLLPGLGSLLRVEQDRDLTVIGSGRSQISDDDFRQTMQKAFTSVKLPKATAAKIATRSHYVQGDPTQTETLEKVLAKAKGQVVVYFALPPSITVKICEVLEQMDLPEGLRLAMEKPFGTDRGSAIELNKQLQRVVPEEQIYRVDHFLATATVLNLVGLRSANRALQLIWNSEQIERVEIVYDENLALEGRAAYYDHSGALRDMLQSHLLQVLSLFAMEPAASLQPTELHDLQAQVLRATRVWGEDPTTASRRARYTEGYLDGRHIPAYTTEEGVDPKQNTETLAEVTLEVQTNRWAGVPITLRSGKGLGNPRKQIICDLRPVPHLPVGFADECTQPDRLTIGLNPGSVTLDLSMNSASPLVLEQKQLTTELEKSEMTAYGEVLRHIFDGNQLLAVRADISEESWRVFEPVLAAWDANDVPMDEYPAGSSGPWPLNPRV